MNNKEKAVRIMDVMPVNGLNGVFPSELNDVPLYEVVSPGVLKLSCGVRKNNNMLVFDVSMESEEFKKKHYNKIVKMQVFTIKGLRDETLARPGRIATILPLTGVYSDLTRDEVKSLGNDFVTVENVQDGLKITPLVTTKTIPDNMHLRVHPERLEEDVVGKISSEWFEVIEIGQDLYKDAAQIGKDKNFS